MTLSYHLIFAYIIVLISLVYKEEHVVFSVVYK